MSTMKSKINRYGQITIPWLLRVAVDAQPGDEFNVELAGPGRIELRHIQTRWPWAGTKFDKSQPASHIGG